MIIRDTYGERKLTSVQGDCIEIMAEDGRELFSVELKEDGSIYVRASSFCKFNGEVLDTSLIVKPVASNLISVKREEYK